MLLVLRTIPPVRIAGNVLSHECDGNFVESISPELCLEFIGRAPRFSPNYTHSLWGLTRLSVRSHLHILSGG